MEWPIRLYLIQSHHLQSHHLPSLLKPQVQLHLSFSQLSHHHHLILHLLNAHVQNLLKTLNPIIILKRSITLNSLTFKALSILLDFRLCCLSYLMLHRYTSEKKIRDLYALFFFCKKENQTERKSFFFFLVLSCCCLFLFNLFKF